MGIQSPSYKSLLVSAVPSYEEEQQQQCIMQQQQQQQQHQLENQLSASIIPEVNNVHAFSSTNWN